MNRRIKLLVTYNSSTVCTKNVYKKTKKYVQKDCEYTTYKSMTSNIYYNFNRNPAA